jgi:hypothetical protein
MTRRAQLRLSISLLGLLPPLAAAAHASSYSGTLTITCTDFSDPAPSTVTFDRDNTGSGSEAYRYVATDGAGSVIFSHSSQLPLGSYTLGSASFSPPPLHNPLTVTLFSLAGNGLPEQTVFSISGSCDSLPVPPRRAPVNDQSGVTTANGWNISAVVTADDFDVASPTVVTSAKVWLADSDGGDNGTLDEFSGALSWGLYHDDSGAPGPVVSHGKAVDIVQIDSHIQAPWGDVVAVGFDFDQPLVLAPGRYWLALHENAWQAAFDGTVVWWEIDGAVSGSQAYQAGTDGVSFALGASADDMSFTLYGGSTTWNDTPFDVITAYDITAFGTAADFTLSTGQTVSTIDAWLWDDGVGGINGTFDGFSGTLSWGIYSNSSGKPGTLLAHGDDPSPKLAVVGSGLGLYDIARARISMRRSLTLTPGTYWLALHEGAWGSSFDGTQIYWGETDQLIGANTLQDGNGSNPTTWDAASIAKDTAFVLYQQQIFASGFETGGTCAWSSSGGLCP